MRNVIFIFFVFECFYLQYCSNKNDKIESKNIRFDSKSISQISSDYDSLIYKVKYRGDAVAYDELYYCFLDAGTYYLDSIIYYSEIMARNHNYHDAYFRYLDAFLEKKNVNCSDGVSKLNLSKLNSKDQIIIRGILNKMLKEEKIKKTEYDSIKW